MKLALIISQDDVKYLPCLKPILAGHRTKIFLQCPDTTAEISSEFDGAIVSQETFLQKLAQKTRRVAIDNYAGSLFWRGEKPFVIIDPLAQIVTTRTGEFLTKRYISKVIRPELWQNEIQFNWREINNTEEFQQCWYEANQSCVAMSIDIETAQEPLRIQICSYSLILKEINNKIFLKNFTFEINDPIRYSWMKQLNELPVPKIFQNGIYDNSWFICYNCPPQNWLFDTMDLFHSWYSELPKKLDFVTSFCVRDVRYWKADNKTGSREDFLRYGCMDVWATSCSFLYLIQNLPDWAWRNYVEKFPLNFPSLLCGLRGWKIDTKTRSQIKEQQIPEIEDNKSFLCSVVGNKNFNPGSWQQVGAILNILSTKGKIEGTDKKAVEKVAQQHPLNEIICKAISDYKTAKKLVTSYLEAELHNGRFLYTLSPSGTDTGRLASHGSVFWTGNSIQTIPRGSIIKSCFIADDGFYLAEPDAEQAETRCTAYLSGDENLIDAVESPLDFHTVNATKFFGLAYEDITIELRDLIKRVGHGANYNMGESVLLATMGIRNVVKAKKLLQLPDKWTLRQVTGYLLETYNKRYPEVKGSFYQNLKDCVQATHKVTSPLGWTRFFFGKPWEHKPDLNALVAHVPQNLNVGIINRSFLELYELEKKTNGNFKLLAQIHDSIPFQYKIGRLDLAVEAAKIMEKSWKIKDCKGIERNMLIPISLKAEAARWSEIKKIHNWREL